jgi:hypothetical protein
MMSHAAAAGSQQVAVTFWFMCKHTVIWTEFEKKNYIFFVLFHCVRLDSYIFVSFRNTAPVLDGHA